MNTLVLSHNAVASLGSWVGGAAALEKLSLSHNELAELGGALKGCAQLQELRLNHNRLRCLPPELASNTRLRILDAGGNPIASFEDIQVRRGRVVVRPHPLQLPTLPQALLLAHCWLRPRSLTVGSSRPPARPPARRCCPSCRSCAA